MKLVLLVVLVNNHPLDHHPESRVDCDVSLRFPTSASMLLRSSSQSTPSPLSSRCDSNPPPPDQSHQAIPATKSHFPYPPLPPVHHQATSVSKPSCPPSPPKADAGDKTKTHLKSLPYPLRSRNIYIRLQLPQQLLIPLDLSPQRSQLLLLPHPLHIQKRTCDLLLHTLPTHGLVAVALDLPITARLACARGAVSTVCRALTTCSGDCDFGSSWMGMRMKWRPQWRDAEGWGLGP